MAALRGELRNEKGSEATRLGRSEMTCRIHTWDVALECWINKDGFGECNVFNQKTGERLAGHIRVTPDTWMSEDQKNRYAEEGRLERARRIGRV